MTGVRGGMVVAAGVATGLAVWGALTPRGDAPAPMVGLCAAFAVVAALLAVVER